MRPPTLVHMIAVSAVVGIVVLFTKHPEPPAIVAPSPATQAALAPAAPAPAASTAAAPAPTAPAPGGPVTAAPAAALPPWVAPDPDKLPDDSFGRSVRYGRDLIVHTSALIGPDAQDAAMRYSGNGLECQSCHLGAGARRFGLPLAGVWGLYPAFMGREDEVRTMEERINGCMERSMNGRALPGDGPEMKAMLAYFRFLSEGLPVGEPMPGRGSPALPLPQKASDPRHGADVFQAQCAGCHQPDGQGKRLEAVEAAGQRRRFEFPPLWGAESYNDGAGMARSISFASFVRANMPLGIDFEHPVLVPQDAFDVAAFVNSQPRPHKAGLEADYPDRALKPVDTAYPPFADPFPAEQHRLGPWPPIREWLKANAGSIANARDVPAQ